MNSRRAIIFVLCSALILIGVRAAFAHPSAEPDEKSAFAADDARILAEIQNNSEAMTNLEYLSDSIGARLTGTAGLKRANDWTRQKFAEYGLTNAHLEPWTVAKPWTRGTASARITAPSEHPLSIASAAWSPGTPGAVHGLVVYFDAKEKKDFEKFRGKLKGAILIYQEPANLSPQQPLDHYRAFTRPMQQPPARVGEPPLADPYDALLQSEKDRTDFWKEQGVAAVLRDSGKPEGLLNMTDISMSRYAEGTTPTAFITGEGYRMIWRLMKHGPVTVEIEMTNTFGNKPVEVYNTVADLRGSERPDEMVIIGGHLDSWDLATGSTDNGTGSMAVLEAARALAKLKLKPKRTIRFVLFSGEEQGLYGSEEYVKAHVNELEKISAVLVHDTGTGRVLSLGLHDNYQDRELVDQVLTPLPVHASQPDRHVRQSVERRSESGRASACRVGLQHGAASRPVATPAASVQSGAEAGYGQLDGERCCFDDAKGSLRRDGYENHRAGEERRTGVESRPGISRRSHRPSAYGFAATRSREPLDRRAI
jgi:carboxypeptidase Q